MNKFLYRNLIHPLHVARSNIGAAFRFGKNMYPAQKKPAVSPAEIVATPNMLMNSLMKYVPSFDPGLITTTGKSLLEEEKGLEVFNEMMRDPQVISAISVKKWAVTASRWHVAPRKGMDLDEEAQTIAKFVEWNLSTLLGDTGLRLDPVLSAFAYGRSDCEIVYDVVPSGEFKGKYYIKEIKPKNVGYITYEMDDYSNIINYVVVDHYGNEKKVKPWKMIHYTWNGEFGNPYGVPDLGAAYPYYWLKKQAYKNLAIFMDKYASPIPVFYPEKNLTAAEKAALKTAANDYHISNSLVMPKGTKLEMEQNNGAGGSVYIAAIHECDAQVTRSILLQTLSTNENQKTGTHAQAKVHEKRLGDCTRKVQDDVEAIVEGQMIKRLVDINFTGSDKYPRFWFEPLDPDFISSMSDAVDKMIGSGIAHVEEPILREMLNLPERDWKKYPKEEPLMNANGVNNGPQQGSGFGKKPAPSQPQKPGAKK
jgi:phage gp29-like protein